MKAQENYSWFGKRAALLLASPPLFVATLAFNCGLPEQACWAVDCSGLGRCVLEAGVAVCKCDQGYQALGLSCVDAAAMGLDTCADVACSGHGSCMSTPVIHCMCDAGYTAQDLECIPESSQSSPCDGIDCSGHGYCMGNTPETVHCMCDKGYVADGLACNPDTTGDPCDGVNCSGHGSCMGDTPETVHCMCDGGYAAVGLECVLSANPCDGITCSGRGQCEGTTPADVTCNCDENYRHEGLKCVSKKNYASPACFAKDCSGHGWCMGSGASAHCMCDPNFSGTGSFECVPI